MGRYRARDLLLVPSWLSLARVPLAVAFPFSVSRPWLAVLVLVSAGATDVFDGWYARRHNQATPIGSVVDGVTDKIFVLSVVGTLFVLQHLSVLDVLLLASRELGELPLVVWWALSHHERRRRAEAPQANVPGKLATTLQFATVALITAGMRDVDWLIVTTAVVGLGAAASYWRRELSAGRAE